MATWRKGQAWRVVESLDRLNVQIKAAYPRAVPPATPVTSWGALADDEHNSTSDHYPHYYAALGKTAVVCARDFPHAPKFGLDAHALAERLRQARDPRVAYIISNGRETGPHHDWEWDPYDGDDPHDTHIHVSTVHTAVADDARDWQKVGEDNDMLTNADKPIIQNAIHNTKIGRTDTTFGMVMGDMRGLPAAIAALRTDIAALAGKDPVNEAELAASLAPALLSVLTPQAIADAIPDSLAGDVASELAARLAT